MRWCQLIGIAGLCLLVGTGCSGANDPLPLGDRPSPLPPLDQIAKVRLILCRLPNDAFLKDHREAILTERADVAEVYKWLEGIDWSQEGMDLKAVKLAAPDGEIEIATKDGTSSHFSFYWDGGLIHTRANRLIRGGDMAKMRKLVERVCK